MNFRFGLSENQSMFCSRPMDFEEANTSPTREKLSLLWNSVQRIVSTPDAKDSNLTEDHELRIRRYYSQLLSNLNVPDVVAKMFESGKLTAKELEHLRQFHSAPIRASEELLEIIIISPRDVYECFLESLKKTNQHHVYQMLTSDEENEQSMFKHSCLIRQNYDWLTETLETDLGLLTTLYAKQVLSHREHGQILSEKDRSVKNETLLSIISRKSVDDYNKFIIALNDTLQGHIAKRLTETPVGDVNQNVQPTVKKIIQSPCSESTGKRIIPPKPPPKPKQQPLTVSLSKPMIIRSKPLFEPKIHPSRPDRIEKRQNYTTQEMVKKQSVEYLETKFRGLPNELQTEVSTKIVLIHQKTSEDSIWKICLTNILKKSRNILRQSTMQAKVADETYERQMEEIMRREREFKIIKEDMQREKTRTKEQLRELHERVYELEERLIRTNNENKNLFERLKASHFKVENLTALNQQKEQKINETVSIIETLQAQIMQSEVQLKEMRDQRIKAEDQLKQNELHLKTTTMKLREIQEKLQERKCNLYRLEAKQIMAEKSTANSSSEDLLDFNQNFQEERTVWAEERKQFMKQVQDLQHESSDNVMRLLGLKQNLETERTVWAEEIKQLRKQAQELQQESPDELQDKYKSDPVLVATIRPKLRKRKKLNIRGKTSEEIGIRGLTILDKELFVVSDDSSEVEVYNSIKLSFSRRWNLKKLRHPDDIGSCNRNKCLYIFDYKGDGQSKEILRVDPNGKLINKWSTGDDDGWGLSVTDESNVILTVFKKTKLNEYSPDGRLIREIYLSSDAGICNPLHAIKLSSDYFLVSHGYYDDDLHRVCIVDADGNLRKSFGGKRGSTIGQLSQPNYLSVDGNGFLMVADYMNSRVLLLDSDLEFKREILSKEKHGIRRPEALLLSNDRLFVVDNESNNQRILIFDLK